MFSRLKKSISNVIPYIFTKTNAWAIGKGVILTGAGMTLDYLAPYFFSETVITLATEVSYTTIAGITFSPIGLIAVTGAITLGRQLTSNYTNEVLAPVGPRATERLLIKYVDTIVNESQDSRSHSDSGDRDFDIQNTFRMNEVGSNLCAQVIPTVLKITVGGIILSKNYGAVIGLPLIGFLPIYAAYNIVTKNYVTRARDNVQKQGNESYRDLSKALIHAETLQIYNTERLETIKVADSLRDFVSADIKTSLVINKVARGQDFLITLSQTALCLLAGKMVMQQKLTVQDFILISTYLSEFFTPLNLFGMAINLCVSGLTALDTVFNRIEASQRIADNFPHVKLELKESEIEFKNVSFRYPQSKEDLFSGISFKMRRGNKIGIVGTSGSGKSTIGKLLYRFYDVTSGEILIDGTDIRSVGLESLRSQIGIIQQKSIIFNETVRNNIAYGAIAKNEKISEDEIKSAAKKAHAEFIDELEKGFETKLGENGLNLSGGQEQRIAIARAILKKPKILISDEATSALDAKSEHGVQSSIDDMIKNEDIVGIVITHKLTNVVNADMILVFDKGRIVERGTHPELLAKNGCYRALWNKFIADSNSESEKQLPRENITAGYPGMTLFSKEAKDAPNTESKNAVDLKNSESRSSNILG